MSYGDLYPPPSPLEPTVGKSHRSPLYLCNCLDGKGRDSRLEKHCIGQTEALWSVGQQIHITQSLHSDSAAGSQASKPFHAGTGMVWEGSIKAAFDFVGKVYLCSLLSSLLQLLPWPWKVSNRNFILWIKLCTLTFIAIIIVGDGQSVY